MTKIDTSDFSRKVDKVLSAYRKMPNEIAAIAVEFSKERFREQAWLDVTKESWKPRKQRRKGGKNKSQTLLVNKGTLKRSIRKVLANENTIIIGTNVKYAQIQNDGGVIRESVHIKDFERKAYTRLRQGRKETVRAHKVSSHNRQMNIRIPARPFLGVSYTLERRIYQHITASFMRALK